MTSFKMHSGMRVGSPVLRVSNIDKILEFYEKKLGLQVKRRHKEDNDGSLICKLGFNDVGQTEESLLQLQHDPNAENASPHSAGLFHFPF